LLWQAGVAVASADDEDDVLRPLAAVMPREGAAGEKEDRGAEESTEREETEVEALHRLFTELEKEATGRLEREGMAKAAARGGKEEKRESVRDRLCGLRAAEVTDRRPAGAASRLRYDATTREDIAATGRHAEADNNNKQQ
jgi:hypothetical protein